MDIIRRKRHLPHWDVPGATYFVTTCLAGSIPAEGLLDIRRWEQLLSNRPCPQNVVPRQWRVELWKRLFAKRDEWLDFRPAIRHLENEYVAIAVQNSLYYFAGERYDLLAYVVMPSHFHWLFRPLESWVRILGPPARQRPPRERIMHSLKRYTARAANGILGTQGTFWQAESYDHVVRDEDEFYRIVEYIEMNPVKAGLVGRPEEWRFSSARDRAALGMSRRAQPLTRDVQKGVPAAEHQACK